MRAALIIACSITMLPAGVWACGEEADTVEGRGSIEPCTLCPVPSCAAPPCIDFGSSPFTLDPVCANGPAASASIGCFAVAKKEPGYHLLLDSAGATFERQLARRGLDDWFPPVPVSGLTTASYAKDAVQCPDPHFTDTTGGMVLIYNVQVKPAVLGVGGWGIARATSTDHGLTWIQDPNPVVAPTATHYPYMPSMTKHGGRYLLAYAWVCKGSATGGADIHVLESTDQINWSPLAVPAISTGDCPDWDNGSANRPRLLSGPDGNAYMFYSGYPWDPDGNGGCGVPNRDCAAIGIAVSADGGATWCKADEPILQIDFGGGFPSNYVGKPSWIWETGQSVVRLYFQGTGGGAGLGIAQADWADIQAFVPPCPSANPGIGVGHLAAHEGAAGDEVRITSSPNPTRGTTSFALDFGRTDRHGELRAALYDVGGRAVRELWSGPAEAAPSSLVWDGRDGGGSRVVTGRYLLRVSRGSETLGAHWVTSIR